MKRTTGSVVLLGIWILLSTNAAVSCAVTYVRSDSAANSVDGSSWEAAFSTIQDALDVAVAGDEVWVAAGTYNERINLKDGIKLYGGFPADGGVWTSRSPAINSTTIDGNQIGVVVTVVEVGADTIIDGFTIRNGKGRFGGGIYTEYCSPTISNNIIVGNSAEYWGGGVLASGGSPLIINNRIIDNVAEYWGGGVALDYDCSAVLLNNVIARNFANRDDGGGIDSWGSAPTIVNNTIAGNSAANGGGVSGTFSDPFIANNIIVFCSSGIGADADTIVSAANNCLFGNVSGNYCGLEPGVDDIFTDPLFADFAAGDLHLRHDSPCINAGTLDVPVLASTDIDGEGRVRDAALDIGADEFWPLMIQLDVKPGEHPNQVNLKSRGLLPVAVLSTPLFNATSIDVATVRLSDASAATRGKNGDYSLSHEDVDGDGNIDLVMHFLVQSLSLPTGTSTITLTGFTKGGIAIEGSDSVVIKQ